MEHNVEKDQPLDGGDHRRIRELLEENAKLLKDNNETLHKIKRHMMWNLIFRIIWYALLLGLPFLLYYSLIVPYFELFGADYNLFQAGMKELPGLKGFENL